VSLVTPFVIVASPPPASTLDINHDGSVTIQDLLYSLMLYGQNTEDLYVDAKHNLFDTLYIADFIADFPSPPPIPSPSSSPAPTLDKFGISQLYPTKISGRVWFSKWDNGIARHLDSGERDAVDIMLIAHGAGSTDIDGNGVAKMTGDQPRLYIYDRAQELKWQNVEVTFYGRQIGTAGSGTAGFTAGARSEHQNVTGADICPGPTYYGRMNYDGRVRFVKELAHGHYSEPVEFTVDWNTTNGNIPKNVWIGYKFVVRNIDNNQHVKLELYRDLTNGLQGGTWEKIAEYVDMGDWQLRDGSDMQALCGFSSTKILLDPGTSVFIRNTAIEEADYKKFSVREIEP